MEYEVVNGDRFDEAGPAVRDATTARWFPVFHRLFEAGHHTQLSDRAFRVFLTALHLRRRGTPITERALGWVTGHDRRTVKRALMELVEVNMLAIRVTTCVTTRVTTCAGDPLHSGLTDNDLEGDSMAPETETESDTDNGNSGPAAPQIPALEGLAGQCFRVVQAKAKRRGQGPGHKRPYGIRRSVILSGLERIEADFGGGDRTRLALAGAIKAWERDNPTFHWPLVQGILRTATEEALMRQAGR